MSDFDNKQAIWQQIQWHEREIEKLRKYLFDIPKSEDKSEQSEGEKP